MSARFLPLLRLRSGKLAPRISATLTSSVILSKAHIVELSLTANLSHARFGEVTDQSRRPPVEQIAVQTSFFCIRSPAKNPAVLALKPPTKPCLFGPPAVVTASRQSLTQALDGAFLPTQTHWTPSCCSAHLSCAVSCACFRPPQASSMHSATGLNHCVILSS